MDSLITAAGHALAAGDPLGALKRVALRDDPPALALRGIAMAQLGDLVRARTLVRRAARAFGPKESLARARCTVAEAEIALASRDIDWSAKVLHAARATLEAHGDRVNAAQARYVEVRRFLLIGRLDQAERSLADLDPTLSSGAADHPRARRGRHRDPARIPALAAEVDSAFHLLTAPAARSIANGEQRLLLLEDVETLFASNALVVDACRRVIRHAGATISLARRPVLFALARTLAEAWPEDASRDMLLARTFGARHVDESHRARLRVEIGRLRRLLRGAAAVSATKRGFALGPRPARDVVVLTPPVEDQHGAVLALLADGESWSSSALALALGASQRTVQRALDALSAGSKVQAFGRGRARRWTMPPLPGFTTTLLLSTALPMN